MNVSPKILKILLVLVLAGFGVGFYLQDLEHKKSTAHAYKANRYNLGKFQRIEDYLQDMNSGNWRSMRDSISQQLDTTMILRYRKEVDSISQIAK